MTRVTRHKRTFLTVTTAAAALLLMPGVSPVGAVFTTQATATDAAEVVTAELPLLTDGSGERDAAGIADVSWSIPAIASSSEAEYEVTRTIGTTTETITPTLSGDTSTVGFTDDLTTPATIEDKTVIQVSAGSYHSCAVTDEGGVYCWGPGFDGRLGNGDTQDSSVPVAVDTNGVLAGKTVTQVSAGGSHSCAVTEDGGVYCWGSGGRGGLGNGDTQDSSVPVAVDTSGALEGKTVTQVSVGDSHSCAMTSDGGVYCWGYGVFGQLGNDATEDSSVPVAVNTNGALAGKTVTQLAAGGFHSCAMADADVYCWGWGAYGQLGNGDSVSSSVPVTVDTTGVLAGKTVTQIAAGGFHSCAVADGGVYCWGYGGNGRLGNDDTASSLVPVAVDTSGALAGKVVTQVSGSGSHSCAVTDDGGVYCWGYGYNGQLGNGDTQSTAVPVAVDTSGALTDRSCSVDWVLTADERCAPGASVTVSYSVTYTLRGWAPAGSALTISADITP